MGLDFIEQHMNCFYLALENSHQNWWKRRFSMPCFLPLLWETPRPTCFSTPCSPQEGISKHFLWGQLYFFYGSGWKKLWIGLESVTVWRNLSRLVFTQLDFSGVKKIMLFWATLLFNFQQMRSHNELALSRSWTWKQPLAEEGKMNLMNLLTQSYKVEQESNVIA